MRGGQGVLQRAARSSARASARVPAHQSRKDLSGPLGTSRDLSGPLGTSRDLSGPLGTSRDISGPLGTSQDLLGHAVHWIGALSRGHAQCDAVRASEVQGACYWAWHCRHHRHRHRGVHAAIEVNGRGGLRDFAACRVQAGRRPGATAPASVILDSRLASRTLTRSSSRIR